MTSATSMATKISPIDVPNPAICSCIPHTYLNTPMRTQRPVHHSDISKLHCALPHQPASHKRPTIHSSFTHLRSVHCQHLEGVPEHSNTAYLKGSAHDCAQGMLGNTRGPVQPTDTAQRSLSCLLQSTYPSRMTHQNLRHPWNTQTCCSHRHHRPRNCHHLAPSSCKYMKKFCSLVTISPTVSSQSDTGSGVRAVIPRTSLALDWHWRKYGTTCNTGPIECGQQWLGPWSSLRQIPAP